MSGPSDSHWMNAALSLAKSAATLDEVPVGALLVKDGKVVGTGFNQRETRLDPTSHAEIHALTQSAKHLGTWRLNDCTLYVTLEPCLMCAGAIQQARIPRVVFGASDPKAGALGSLYQVHQDERLNHRFEVTAGVLAEASAQLLKDFFRSKR